MAIHNCIIIEGRFWSVLNTAVPNSSFMELHKTHVLCKLAREGRIVTRIIKFSSQVGEKNCRFGLGTT